MIIKLISRKGINMNIRNSASTILWLAVVFSTNVIAKDIAIFRWVDENNVVHFSQHQPQHSNYSQLTTFSSYKAREKEIPKQNTLPSVDDPLVELEKERAAVIAKNKEIAKKNCDAARLNEKMLNSFDKIMITAPDGKSNVLSEKEKNAQLELSRKQIDMYCTKDTAEKN